MFRQIELELVYEYVIYVILKRMCSGNLRGSITEWNCEFQEHLPSPEFCYNYDCTMRVNTEDRRCETSETVTVTDGIRNTISLSTKRDNKC